MDKMQIYKSDTASMHLPTHVAEAGIKRISIGCLKYVFAFIAIIAILVLLSSFTSVIQRQHRQELFCEILKPGMSLTYVLKNVDFYGSFGKNEFPHGEDITLLLTPDDFQTIMKYDFRTVALTFDNEQLFRGARDYSASDGGGNSLCE